MKSSPINKCMKKTFTSKYDRFEITTNFKPVDDSISIATLSLKINDTTVSLGGHAYSIDPFKELREVIEKFDIWLESKK